MEILRISRPVFIFWDGGASGKSIPNKKPPVPQCFDSRSFFEAYDGSVVFHLRPFFSVGRIRNLRNDFTYGHRVSKKTTGRNRKGYPP